MWKVLEPLRPAFAQMTSLEHGVRQRFLSANSLIHVRMVAHVWKVLEQVLCVPVLMASQETIVKQTFLSVPWLLVSMEARAWKVLERL